jgi:hypothetical protein
MNALPMMWRTFPQWLVLGLSTAAMLPMLAVNSAAAPQPFAGHATPRAVPATMVQPVGSRPLQQAQPPRPQQQSWVF